MISYRKAEQTTNGNAYAEIELLSTDTKPTDVANGSLALEIDTGDVYAFDEDGGEWSKIVGE